MNLHLLRLFTEVAEQGSFTRAAQALRISQPAVSKGVREFELQLGSPLLERGPGGPRPTVVGEKILANAQTLFSAERAMEEVLRSIRGIETGILSIGASTTVATYYLARPIGTFHAAHPGVELELHSANTREIASLLKRRALDIALVEGPVSDPEFEVTPWRSDQLIAVSGPAHRFAAQRRPLDPAEIAKELFVVREVGSGTREVVMDALGTAGIAPQRVMEVNSTEAVKRLVAAGVGVAMVSRVAAEDLLRDGALAMIRIRGLAVRRTLTRLAIRGRQPTAAAAAFNAVLDKVADAAATQVS